MSLDISNQNHDQIITWQRLKNYKGFQLLVEKLDQIIKESEKIIFMQGADHKTEFTARDLAINKRDVAMELKELPDVMIAHLSGTGKVTPDNPDAYAEAEDFDDEIFMEDDF